MEIYDQRCPICSNIGDHRQLSGNLWQNRGCKDVFHRDEDMRWID